LPRLEELLGNELHGSKVFHIPSPSLLHSTGTLAVQRKLCCDHFANLSAELLYEFVTVNPPEILQSFERNNAGSTPRATTDQVEN
jgi:hypothetical protein